MNALLEAETLDADDAYRAAGIPRRAREPEIVVEDVKPVRPGSS